MTHKVLLVNITLAQRQLPMLWYKRGKRHVNALAGILMALESEHTDVLGISLVHGNVVCPGVSSAGSDLRHDAWEAGLRRLTHHRVMITTVEEKMWLHVQGVDQVARNVARILTLAERCVSVISAARRNHLLYETEPIGSAQIVVRRQEIPFYVGAGEPLLPIDEPMDAVFVRLAPRVYCTLTYAA